MRVVARWVAVLSLTRGAAGSCTNFLGILSNREIKRIIADEGIKPYFNETAMVKYFTY